MKQVSNQPQRLHARGLAFEQFNDEDSWAGQRNPHWRSNGLADQEALGSVLLKSLKRAAQGRSVDGSPTVADLVFNDALLGSLTARELHGLLRGFAEAVRADLASARD